MNRVTRVEMKYLVYNAIQDKIILCTRDEYVAVVGIILYFEQLKKPFHVVYLGAL